MSDPITAGGLPALTPLLLTDLVFFSRDGVVVSRCTVADLLGGLTTDNVGDDSGLSTDSPGSLTSALEALAQQDSDDIQNASSVDGDSVSQALDELADQIAALGGPGAQAEDIGYDPTTPEDWPDSPPPDDVQAALDQLAARTVGVGDVAGPGSSTDNALPRFDGSGGKTLQASGVLVGDNNELYGYRAQVKLITDAAYTLLPEDSGQVLEFSNAGTVDITMPATLPHKWCATLVWAGAGQPRITAGSGGVIRNRHGHAALAAQWSPATLYVRANSGGSAAEAVLAGDTAT